MRHFQKFLLAVASLSAITGCVKEEKQMKMITPVSFSQVRIQDDFWTPVLDKHKNVTVPVCIDQIENQTGRIRNFEVAASGVGEHSGIFFDDSDVYKALEGMAYSLQNNPDPVLEAKCDEWIDKFAAAQQEDGYIYTYYTIKGLENRWADMDKHEMYCAGHMMEAAVAYYKATGKTKLIDVCQKMADYMMSVFGPGKRDWVPGHEEIELALVKLYEVTGNKRDLEFANWLLEERGHGFGHKSDPSKIWNPVYYQDNVPVKDIENICGHAVRAMYLYCGMSDVAAYTHNQDYMDALFRVWDDVVLRNMYVTGGIGSSKHNEGFTEDYDLPNKEAYCETCASIAMIFWNWRMNQFTGDGKYVDVMERCLYNGVLSGYSADGDKFFYVNPLESDGNHHRQAWYGCACCPSQVCRFIPSVGNYIYGLSDDALYVNMYIGNTTDVKFGKSKAVLKMESGFPWNGGVKFSIDTKKTLRECVKFHIPAWCRTYSLSVNGEAVTPVIDKGYAVVDREWTKADVVEIVFDMPVEIVSADAAVKQDEGKRAIQRGPVVYCLEECDNSDGFEKLSLSDKAVFNVAFNADLLNGIGTVTATDGDKVLNFIPYFSWDNREAGRMKVWVDYEGTNPGVKYTDL